MIDVLHRSLQPFTQRMTLALRVAVLTTMAVAATLGVVSAIVFVVVRAEFERSLDESMLRRAHAAVDAGLAKPQYFTRLNPRRVSALPTSRSSPSTAASCSPPPPRSTTREKPFKSYHEIEVSIGQASQSMRTVRIQGTPYRVVAVQAGSGTALVMTQSMESIDYALERLKVILLLCSAAGVALAGVAGWAVAANGLRPVRRLTAATERVARTSELTPIEVTGHDELARLTTSFNAMLQALDASQTRQRQLVADAGHELRTPLTSLRTNIELIGQAADNVDRSLTDDQRHEIMGDVRSQLEELTTLVGDLVELARDEPMTRDPEPLGLRRRRHPGDRPRTPARAQRHVRRRARAVDGVRRAAAARARRHEPARQRGQVEPAPTARSTYASPAAHSPSRTRDPASTRPTCRTSSTGSTARARRVRCPARDLGCRS